MSLPTTDHRISLQQAIDMTTMFRARKGQILNPAFSKVLSISETFNRDIFDALLAQPGAAGIRIYYGMDTTMTIHPIVVAVNSNGDDILPTSTTSTTNDSGTIGEQSQPCPPSCISSPLNP